MNKQKLVFDPLGELEGCNRFLLGPTSSVMVDSCSVSLVELRNA